MFTGIIEEVGRVSSVRRGAHSCVLTVSARTVLSDVHLGDSIATNGVCLTVTAFDDASFSADVMHETLDRSSLGRLRPGSPVNLERAMAADGRFGGHIVSGHIDGIGTIKELTVDDNAVWYRIEAVPALLRHVVEKGSIAIDGISLTVASVDATSFSVSIIPHTRAQTNLATKRAGDVVNLETDVIGKYVERLLGMSAGASGPAAGHAAPAFVGTAHQSTPRGGITESFLLENGF